MVEWMKGEWAWGGDVTAQEEEKGGQYHSKTNIKPFQTFDGRT